MIESSSPPPAFATTEGTGMLPSDGGLVLSSRAFWSVFAGAWTAYAALLLSVTVSQGRPLPRAALLALVSVAGPAVVAVFFAARRGNMLRPGLTLRGLIGRQLVSALAYGIAATAITLSLATIFRIEVSTEWGENTRAQAVLMTISHALLYAVLAGYLLWTESMRRVQESRELAAREAILRAQAEAKALRSQFNPHFVFNTLHSLMLLVRAEPATAEKAIEDVAELIRYASQLQRRGIDQVPLSKELAFAERYLDLEKLRLEDRLNVEWQLLEGVEDVLVPAFSLQTLLENAIKHGIAPTPDGGTVSIAARLLDGTLEMSVSDDGAGAEPEGLVGDGGSGLRLLRQRLRVVHGDSAVLKWCTAPGEGFAASVSIPVRRASTQETAAG